MIKIIDFIKNLKNIYFIAFVLMFSAILMPMPEFLQYIISIISIALFYIVLFLNSIKSANNVFKMICWLLVAPFLITIFVSAYISLLWEPIQQNRYFIMLLFVVFIFSWLFASYRFDLDKIKAAVMILNAIFTTILTIAFLTTLDAEFSKLLFSTDIIKAAVDEGFSESNLIELIIKMITLPYILSAIWAQIIIELRYLKIVGKEKRNRDNCV